MCVGSGGDRNRVDAYFENGEAEIGGVAGGGDRGGGGVLGRFSKCICVFEMN